MTYTYNFAGAATGTFRPQNVFGMLFNLQTQHDRSRSAATFRVSVFDSYRYLFNVAVFH